MLAHVVVFLAVEGDSTVRFERAYCDRESKEASVVAVYPCVTGGCCIGVNTRVCCVLGTTCRCAFHWLNAVCFALCSSKIFQRGALPPLRKLLCLKPP